MLFFCSPEDSLYALFPPGVDPFAPSGMTDVFYRLYILFPYMPGDCLDMALAVGASFKARTIGSMLPTTLIFPVPIFVCCPVCQDVVFRADITVVILIVYILMLLKKPVFCHRSLVRQQR